MRILVLSNLYPPHGIGGYEERCKDAVDGFRDRGHEVCVLTSTHQVENEGDLVPTENDDHVLRKLWLSWFGDKPEGVGAFAAKLAEDLECLEQVLSEWQPDLVHVWSLGGLSKSLIKLLDSADVPVLFDISDYTLLHELKHDLWFKYWQSEGKSPMDDPAVREQDVLVRHMGAVPDGPASDWVQYATFTSEAVRETYKKGGFAPRWCEVIPCGIPLDLFPVSPLKERQFPPRRLLFVGNIRYDKGTHTALEALGLLVGEFPSLHLSLAGECFSWRYREKLNKLIDRFGLHEHVTYLPSAPRSEMSSVYREHDLVVFPSIWEEPFSLVVLEAMASGVPLVGTLSGGSKEILRDEENSLTFTADSAASCAFAIRRLMQDPGLYRRLCEAGPPLIQEKYSAHDMVQRMEQAILQILDR
ncbi:MAG: glycosyltransferase family 1 protein [Deltaproteobacteria bacterium]|nr:MAG: glycosyltransferase family 1 protein [Deltaproteobacteria bacterium]